jgi:hypothetical protein
MRGRDGDIYLLHEKLKHVLVSLGDDQSVIGKARVSEEGGGVRVKVCSRGVFYASGGQMLQ